MYFNFVMNDTTSGRQVGVSQSELEYLGDIGELFLSFLQGVGYSYVAQIVIVKDDGSEVATVR